MKTVQQLILGNHFRLHLVFSLVVLVSLSCGMYFLYLAGFRFENLVSAFTDCFFFLLCIYTGRWLCTRWYLRGHVFQFILFGLVAIACLSLLKFTLVKFVFSHPYAGFPEVVWNAMPLFIVGMVMGILLKLVRVSMLKELKEAQFRAEQSQSEFRLLQAQLSPHFLFNVLNNLYGISIDQHERVPSLLLKLSNLLRYSVYGGRKTYVSLRDELEYIKNYIEFEQIRVSDRLIIKKDIPPELNPDIKIAPLVLIVFIENAFKHAGHSLERKVYIYISMKIEGDYICFSIANSYDKKNKSTMPDDSSGLGLANTIKRLNLLYGNDYELKQESGTELYKVDLHLKIKYG